MFEKKEFNEAVKNTRAYESLLIRVITLECKQGIHREYELINTSKDEDIFKCLNCGAKIEGE